MMTHVEGVYKLLLEREASPAPSLLSMTSDWSMDPPYNFSREITPSDFWLQLEREASPALSCLSTNSNWSMDPPYNFKDGSLSKRLQLKREASPAPSYQSMKSDRSMDSYNFIKRHFANANSELTDSLLTEDHFRCSVCTEVLKDPVSTPCGHSYCRQCITTYWAQPGHAGDYDCPQCRKRSRTRPVFYTNSVLAEVVQKLQQAGFSPALPAHCYAGPGDVACDFCTGRKLRAVKSCLTCSASYCETHVRQHYTVAALQRHTLVEVTADLEQRLCQQHHRALEVFCKTDQTLICRLCAVQEHTGHDITTEDQKQDKTAGSNVEGSEISKPVKREVRDENIDDENPELKMNTKLQQENFQLKQKVSEVEEMNSELKKNYTLEMTVLETENSVIKEENTELKKEILILKIPEYIHGGKTGVAADVTLDPDTAHGDLILSADGKRVKHGKKRKRVPDNPQRFDGWPSVWAREGFSSGRHFWQVGVNKRWIIGVAREFAERKGTFTFSPHKRYWCLSYCGSFSALAAPETPLPKTSVPKVLGVCVDVEERWVSFYNAVSRAHVYTFTDMVFSGGEKIYPVFFTLNSKDLEMKTE